MVVLQEPPPRFEELRPGAVPRQVEDAEQLRGLLRRRLRRALGAGRRSCVRVAAARTSARRCPATTGSRVPPRRRWDSSATCAGTTRDADCRGSPPDGVRGPAACGPGSSTAPSAAHRPRAGRTSGAGSSARGRPCSATGEGAGAACERESRAACDARRSDEPSGDGDSGQCCQRARAIDQSRRSADRRSPRWRSTRGSARAGVIA